MSPPDRCAPRHPPNRLRQPVALTLGRSPRLVKSRQGSGGMGSRSALRLCLAGSDRLCSQRLQAVLSALSQGPSIGGNWGEGLEAVHQATRPAGRGLVRSFWPSQRYPLRLRGGKSWRTKPVVHCSVPGGSSRLKGGRRGQCPPDSERRRIRRPERGSVVESRERRGRGGNRAEKAVQVAWRTRWSSACTVAPQKLTPWKCTTSRESWTILGSRGEGHQAAAGCAQPDRGRTRADRLGPTGLTLRGLLALRQPCLQVRR